MHTVGTATTVPAIAAFFAPNSTASVTGTLKKLALQQKKKNCNLKLNHSSIRPIKAPTLPLYSFRKQHDTA